MRRALDQFEVEGIGHNLPFLSAVMDHPRFISGEITTAFIEEEYPDGLQPPSLTGEEKARFIAVAAVIRQTLDRRRATAAEIGGAVADGGARADYRCNVW